MGEISQKTNYIAAKEAADRVDAQIINALKEGLSFRVEAGAGSGKTYSLKKIIEWIQENKWEEYHRKKQNVVCITYTNAAVDVLTERLSSNSFILPSTIHSFAWSAIKQYQSTLISLIGSDENFQVDEGDFSKVSEVRYTLGHRYKENGIQFLYHEDVLKLFCLLLDNAKYRRFFSDKYPLILIDEYQDSYKPIIDRFVEYFIANKQGTQFGFFGDAWQTIYQSNNACGCIVHDNLVVIEKGSNFRSAPQIVQLLNNIRPDLPQQSAIDEYDGEVVIITNDDYIGVRRTGQIFKDDLPAEELRTRLNTLTKYIQNQAPSEETIKVLMITHKVLATQQGYEKLLDILKDGLRDKQDPFLLFFMNTVEPIYKALKSADMQLLFETLGIRRYPITKKSEKVQWKLFEQTLEQARTKRSIDVLRSVICSKLIPIPPQIESYYLEYCSTPDMMYTNETTIKDFLELDYGQFLAVIDFLYPEAVFSTDHGVKGEEYDNVIFVIGRGWNQYQFETYIPMINGSVPIPKGKEASYERNRNLFYVCCSRPKKRLFIFITVPLTPAFKTCLSSLAGNNNIYTYTQYLNKVK